MMMPLDYTDLRIVQSNGGATIAVTNAVRGASFRPTGNVRIAG